MCFTPLVSIIIASIEFLLAVLIFFRFRKSRAARFTIPFLLLLGLYQFTQFMLCTTGNAGLWVRAGFIAYTVLPAIALHFALVVARVRMRAWMAYIPAVTFAALPLLMKSFVTGGSCNTVYVTAEISFFQEPAYAIPFAVYCLFYFGCIALACYFFSRRIATERRERTRKYFINAIMLVALVTFAAFLFSVFLPSQTIKFPSIYCEFALLFALGGYLMTAYDAKHQVV